ncbi:MAG: hypothetical protein Q8O99_05815 [bacterium]|nr:hypothetical protein [bacterium]
MEVMSDVLLNLLTSKADATKAEEMMDSVREYLSKYPGMSDEEKRLIVRTSVTPFFTEQFSPCLMGHAVGLREDKDLPRLLGYARLLEPYLTEQDFHQAMIAYMMRYGKGRIAFLLYDTNPSVYANTKRRKNLLETHLARWKWKALSLQFQKRCGENHLGKEVRTELLEGVVGELTNMRYRVE